MSKFVAPVLSFLCMVNVVVALKNLYFVRHCDKINDSDPCCSSLGYQRANAWSTLLDSLLLGKEVSIYSALADYDTLCRPNVFYDKDKDCQRSQRLAVSAMYLNYNLNSSATMQLDYCVGDYQKIVNDITEDAKTMNRGVVIWQHDEIIDMLRSFNVKNITDWPVELSNEYSIIFQLQFASDSDKYPIMTYNCYEFQYNRLHCSDSVVAWLGQFPQFNAPLSPFLHQQGL